MSSIPRQLIQDLDEIVYQCKGMPSNTILRYLSSTFHISFYKVQELALLKVKAYGFEVLDLSLSDYQDQFNSYAQTNNPQYHPEFEIRQTINMAIQYLMQPTIYNTPPVLSSDGKILTSQVYYKTVNEEYIIQTIMQEYQIQKKKEANAWRLGVGIAATALGLGDGFQISDFLYGAIAGAMASGSIASLQELDAADLKALNLEWINSPDSYVYHVKRHKGSAVRRLLLLTANPATQDLATCFGVQFPDGYVSKLSLILSGHLAGSYAVSSYGFDANLVKERTIVKQLQMDNGIDVPLEIWRDAQGSTLVALPYQAPHDYLY